MENLYLYLFTLKTTLERRLQSSGIAKYLYIDKVHYSFLQGLRTIGIKSSLFFSSKDI